MQLSSPAKILIAFLFIVLLADLQSEARKKRKYRKKKLKSRCKYDSEVVKLSEKLWNLDVNRLKYGKDFRTSYQGKGTRIPLNKTKDANPTDNASRYLLSYVNQDVFKRPTFKALVDILDNYNYKVGVAEDVKDSEVVENTIFIELVFKSAVMKEVYKFLRKREIVEDDDNKFKGILYSLWFEDYSRQKRKKILDSSGFEHVFVGEVYNNQKIVGGFHNWIQTYRQERQNNFNYLGYLQVIKDFPYIATTQYTWRNALKPIGGGFIGTSPEFEFSLFTLASLLGYEKTCTKLGGKRITVTCFGTKSHVLTCYPVIAPPKRKRKPRPPRRG